MDQAHDPHALDPSMAAHLADKSVGFPELNTREFRAFHNGLRILHSLDVDEVNAPRVVLIDRDAHLFIRNPVSFLIKATDRQRDAIWRALQARQPADLRDPADDPLKRANREKHRDAAQAGDRVRAAEDVRALSPAPVS